MDSQMTETVYIFELLGVIAFALSGILLANHKRMDPIGAFSLAFATAFGGGTLRDLILDRRPIYWIENPEMPMIVLGLALVLSYIKTGSFIKEKYIMLPDSLGLALFSIAGTQIALAEGHSWFISSLLGVCSAVAGGVIRDVLANELPVLFKRSHLYATCSFVGCWSYILLQYFKVGESLAALISLALIATLRFISLRFDLTLYGVNKTDKSE